MIFFETKFRDTTSTSAILFSFHLFLFIYFFLYPLHYFFLPPILSVLSSYSSFPSSFLPFPFLSFPFPFPSSSSFPFLTLKQRTGQGFLLVYSITSRPSFEEAFSIHEQLLRVKDSDDVPIILVANKSDLDHERYFFNEQY